MKRLSDPVLLLATLVWLAVLIVAPDTFAGTQPAHAGPTTAGTASVTVAVPCHATAAGKAASACDAHACCTQAAPTAAAMTPLLPFSPQRRAATARALRSYQPPPPDEPPRA